jgi:hypothetical protein
MIFMNRSPQAGCATGDGSGVGPGVGVGVGTGVGVAVGVGAGVGVALPVGGPICGETGSDPPQLTRATVRKRAAPRDIAGIIAFMPATAAA